MITPIMVERLTMFASSIVAVILVAFGALVYLNDKKNLINRLFLILTVFTAIWVTTVIISALAEDQYLKVLAGRAGFASATIIAFCIYHFIYHFPIKSNFNERRMPLLTLCLVVSLLSLFTPLMIVAVEKTLEGIESNVYGAGYYIFAAYFIGFIILSFWTLYSKLRFLDKLQVIQSKFILAGIIAASILAFTTNLILPRLTGSNYATFFGPSMILFFLAPAAYAILKHHTFNLKVIGSGFLTFAIWIFILLRVLISNSLEEFVSNFLLLVAVSFFGTFLIKSVVKEVQQREHVEKLAQDLKEANTRLKNLDAARREFLSFASHQLKTPMTVIKGYAALAADPNYLNSPERMKKIIGKIASSTDQMYRLISNFLDARAIEEGKMSYIFKPTDIVKLASSIVEEFIPYAAQKGLQLTFSSSAPSITINADETKFRQVIQNLIDNAIKYTEKGYVNVGIVEDELSTLLNVTDTGRGIPQGIKERLFGQFVRDGSAALKAQGTGLGLYIAKEIVKAHQGEIWVESEGEGKGSKFIVRLQKLKG